MVYILKAIQIANQFVSSVNKSAFASFNLSNSLVNLGKLFFREIFVSRLLCCLSYSTKV